MAKRGKEDTYGKGVERAVRRVEAPDLSYKPQDPASYRPPIGLIGCGGITQSHLRAYRKAGYDIVALCDLNPDRAEARRREFFPAAKVYTDHRQLLRRDDIEVIDIATHPDVRKGQIRDCLLAGKHVLSQKPFVLDLAEGHRFADLADNRGLKLAVNQNGRWAPHFSYIRSALAEGLIGDVLSAHLSVHWNHDWIAGTPFDSIPQVILYDFAIHWFDIVTCFMDGRQAKRVYASTSMATGQRAQPPLLAQALIEYDDAQASVVFDGFTQQGPKDNTFVAGSLGSIESTGPNLDKQTLTLTTARGVGRPHLRGAWFPDGFHGTMAELLCSIDEHRQPSNNARDNLISLALCFAAVRSAMTGRPQFPGQVTRMSALRSRKAPA